MTVSAACPACLPLPGLLQLALAACLLALLHSSAAALNCDVEKAPGAVPAADLPYTVEYQRSAKVDETTFYFKVSARTNNAVGFLTPSVRLHCGSSTVWRNACMAAAQHTSAPAMPLPHNVVLWGSIPAHLPAGLAPPVCRLQVCAACPAGGAACKPLSAFRLRLADAVVEAPTKFIKSAQPVGSIASTCAAGPGWWVRDEELLSLSDAPMVSQGVGRQAGQALQHGTYPLVSAP